MALLGVDIQDSKRAAQAFHRRYGWRWPSIFDPRGEIARRLGAFGTPTAVFLSKAHRIVARIAGGADLAALEDTYRRRVG